jgi:hypothetical protein
MEDPKDKSLDNEENESLDPDEENTPASPGMPAALRNFISVISEAAEELNEEEQKRLAELYGEEKFEDDGLTYADDLAKYDQAAYTRNKQDYTAYRYNLSQPAAPGVYEQDGLAYYEEGLDGYGDGLGGDLDAGSASEPAGGRTTFGGAPAKGGHTYYPSSAKSGKGGYNYSYSYAGGGSWASSTGGWQSSWYSGYKSADLAIKGVHDNVSSFVTAPGYGALEIVPDLERVDDASIIDPAIEDTGRHSVYGRYGGETDKTMVVRIDSTLYEKLGIAEAQQHYIVDAISQVFAIQTYPDPFLLTLLQAGTHGTVIPSVTKEIITEMMRAKGLPLLLDQMPGWQKRVTAFRSAMYVGEPPDGSIPAAYLMYGIWERDSVSSLEQEDAIAAIDSIEELLNTPAKYLDDFKALRNHSGGDRDKVKKARTRIITDIDTVLVRYVTNHGSAGEVLRMLRLMHDSLTDKLELLLRCNDGRTATPAHWLDGEALYRDTCEQLIPLIHDHNRTFCPDPTDTRNVRHMDFPECPNLGLLREELRSRVEFSRKCLFNLVRIPQESITKGPLDNESSNVQTAAKRVKDMIQHIEKTIAKLLEAAEAAARNGRGAGNREDIDGKRGNNSTNHPELRSKSPIGGSTERNFNGEDPAFSRAVTVFDCTIAET